MRDRLPMALARVPVLVVVGVAALVCSLSPEGTIGGFTFVRPSALLFNVVPMFRSYARFGVVVQLMAALLAGIGVDYLRCTRTRRAQIVCLALVALAAGEYAVAPSALWRDALPTSAHRWVTQLPGPVRALDCVPLNQESESVQWLTGDRVTILGSPASDCTEPNFSRKLAAMGYTHLLVRRRTAPDHWFTEHPTLDGFRVAADFADGRVFAVTAGTPALFTATMRGFYPREHDTEWTWRWMGKDATWTIVSMSARPIATTLEVELSAFHRPRRMHLWLDGQQVMTFVVEPSRHVYEVGPLTVMPGGHTLLFQPAEEPTTAAHVVNNGDRRRLSFALGTWNWSVLQGGHP